MNSDVFSCSPSTFGDFLESKNIDFNDNLDYSEFPIELVAKMSKEKLIENFHFDKKFATEIHALLAVYRKKFRYSPKSATKFLKNLNIFKIKNETNSQKFLDFFVVNDSTFFQISRGHHANMDLITLAYSGHSKHFEHFVKTKSKEIGIPKVNLVNQVTGEGWTPLMYASMLGDEIICKFLFENDVNMKIRNCDGQTALMIASSYGHSKIIQLFFDFAMKKSKMFKNQNCSEIIKNEVLLNFADKNGQTALHYAVHYNQEDAVKILLFNGANPNIPDNQGMTPTLLACSNTNCGIANKKCLIELIKYGGKINYRNKDGKTGSDLAFNSSEILEISNLYAKRSESEISTKRSV